MKCPKCSEPVVVESYWSGVRHRATGRGLCGDQRDPYESPSMGSARPGLTTLAPDTLPERILWHFKWFRQISFQHHRACDCSDCENDNGYRQRVRRGHDGCEMPASCRPPAEYLHSDKRCPKYGTTTLVGTGEVRF